MRSWLKSPKTRYAALAVIIILAATSVAVFWDDVASRFRTPDPSLSKILVLDDCDDHFRLPQDAVIGFDSKGKPVRRVSDLNICQTVGGPRSLSASPDGRFFLVCENVADELTAYDTQTGRRLWSVDGKFDSATVAPDGTIYALINAGTIYGDQIAVLSQQGEILKQAKVGGLDIALDAERKALWLVGANIKKCDLDLNVVHQLDPIGWCAVSVDVNTDGSVWVAEREYDPGKGTNRLLRISPDGLITKEVKLDFSPMCLRVDRSDGSVWVTGGGGQKTATTRLMEAIEKRTGRLPTGKRIHEFLTRYRGWSRTHKYDAEGNLLHQIKQGGHTIDIDRTDGTIWIAGKGKVYHYSRDGKKLSKSGGMSGSQEYILVVPASNSIPSTTQNRTN